jgi:glutaredoxin-like protein
MPLLAEKDKAYLKTEFGKKLVNPVRLVMFTQTFACDYCKDTEQILQELAGLSELITVEIHNFVTDADKAKEYRVDKIPAVAIIGQKDYGIRFFGIPAGYEFTTLVEDLINVSRADSGLSKETRAILSGLAEPVHIQVFVTPT